MRALAIVVVLLAMTPAHAETPVEAKSAMQDYFNGEKTGGYILVALGIGGIATGTYLVKDKCEVRKGLSYPLLAFGTLHVLAGVYIGMSSDSRIDKFGGEIDRDGQAWVERERERMDGVKTQFTVLKLVEVGLVAGGATMAYLGWKHRRGRLEGAGIGIAVEAAITLGFDLWASHRANGYRDKLGGIEIVTPRLSLTF